MKIAVCATSDHEEAQASSRYARSDYFAIYDTDTKAYEFLENEAKRESSGAANKATKILGDRGASVLLAPKVGPKAFEMLDAFDIEVYQYDAAMTVNAALESYFEERLLKITAASKEGHAS
ncbi:MAG: NifB/NifX family molybdenum-iron cluster-binding protein [Bacillota bacterium]